MKKFLRFDTINFDTTLKYSDIIEIAEKYINSLEDSYEIDMQNILYDPNSYVTNEPVWMVFFIAEKNKKRFPDAYFTLAISDSKKRLVYVQNDHGVVIKRFWNPKK